MKMKKILMRYRGPSNWTSTEFTICSAAVSRVFGIKKKDRMVAMKASLESATALLKVGTSPHRGSKPIRFRMMTLWGRCYCCRYTSSKTRKPSRGMYMECGDWIVENTGLISKQERAVVRWDITEITLHCSMVLCDHNMKPLSA